MNKKILIILILLLSQHFFTKSDIAEPNMDAWLYLSCKPAVIENSLMLQGFTVQKENQELFIMESPALH